MFVPLSKVEKNKLTPRRNHSLEIDPRYTVAELLVPVPALHNPKIKTTVWCIIG